MVLGVVMRLGLGLGLGLGLAMVLGLLSFRAAGMAVTYRCATVAATVGRIAGYYGSWRAGVAPLVLSGITLLRV